MKIKLLALPAAGAALLAFGAAACSSDNTAQLDSWAKSVCDAAQGPIGRATAALTDTGQVKQGESPDQLRQRLSGDIAVLGEANRQIAAAVDKAGAPKIDNGAGLQQQAVKELGQAAAGYQEVRKKVDSLPTGDQAKFADGLKSVGDQVQQLAQLSSSAIARLQAGDLGRAIAKQPGCKSAAGASGGASAGASAGTSAGSAGGSAPASAPAEPSPSASAKASESAPAAVATTSNG